MDSLSRALIRKVSGVVASSIWYLVILVASAERHRRASLTRARHAPFPRIMTVCQIDSIMVCQKVKKMMDKGSIMFQHVTAIK